MRAIGNGLASLSFGYGFYRTYSLPMWYTNPSFTKDYAIQQSIRLPMSFAGGIKYVLPPFCIVMYIDLFFRYKESKSEYPFSKGSDRWREWGFIHPSVF